MPDPQQYTDAQLSDGTTLRFIGQLGPDEVRQKVQTYRAKNQPDQLLPKPPLPGALNPHFDPFSPVDHFGLAPGERGVNGDTGASSPTEELKNFGMAAGETAAGVVGAPAAAAALPAALPFLGRGAKAALPLVKSGAKVGVTYAAADAVIKGAKKLPVVGDYVSKMPGIDNIPFLVSMLSHGGKAPAEPAGPGAPLPETPSPELMQSRGLAEPGAAPPPEPSAGLGRLPFIPKPTKLPAGFEPAPEPYRSPIGTADNPASSLSPSRPQLPFLPKPNVGDIGNRVESALGGRPLAPNVPLRQQMPATQAPAANLPEGHTPINSSAVRSYKYDPEAQEFHAQYKSGDNVQHVFGDVSPEDAQAFEQTPSPGKAMAVIQQNHPLVAKIMNGKRVAVRPGAPTQ
jgi:hypothetical protein